MLKSSEAETNEFSVQSDHALYLSTLSSARGTTLSCLSLAWLKCPLWDPLGTVWDTWWPLKMTLRFVPLKI